ncbi:MAG: HAD family hydrolase [Planctomycetia bacterium]|nr:HAD family hydrolase [Planctomycetia bacterium]
MSTETETPIEVLNPTLPRGGYQVALFDFDGTLSLVRRNWQAVMIPMMVDELASTGTAESREALGEIVEEFVMRLNGKQTIYQMMQLADEVTKRGGKPAEPLVYKHRYLDLLWVQIEERVVGLKSGTIPTDDLTVPGSRELLQTLTDRGITPILASGTDLQYVRDEVQALKLDHFFGERIYGALDDYKKFSKAMVIEKIVADLKASGVDPRALVAFGDGYVEIEETKKAGGTAIGVASEEETRQGVNLWKRNRLVGVGADIIVGDYRRLGELLGLLGI